MISRLHARLGSTFAQAPLPFSAYENASSSFLTSLRRSGKLIVLLTFTQSGLRASDSRSVPFYPHVVSRVNLPPFLKLNHHPRRTTGHNITELPPPSQEPCRHKSANRGGSTLFSDSFNASVPSVKI